jgi:hypothetical protein
MDTLFPDLILGHISPINFNSSLIVIDSAHEGDNITQKGDRNTRSFFQRALLSFDPKLGHSYLLSEGV